MLLFQKSLLLITIFFTGSLIFNFSFAQNTNRFNLINSKKTPNAVKEARKSVIRIDILSALENGVAKGYKASSIIKRIDGNLVTLMSAAHVFNSFFRGRAKLFKIKLTDPVFMEELKLNNELLMPSVDLFWVNENDQLEKFYCGSKIQNGMLKKVSRNTQIHLAPDYMKYTDGANFKFIGKVKGNSDYIETTVDMSRSHCPDKTKKTIQHLKAIKVSNNKLHEGDKLYGLGYPFVDKKNIVNGQLYWAKTSYLTTYEKNGKRMTNVAAVEGLLLNGFSGGAHIDKNGELHILHQGRCNYGKLLVSCGIDLKNF